MPATARKHAIAYLTCTNGHKWQMEMLNPRHGTAARSTTPNVTTGGLTMIHYLIDGGRKIPCACPRATDHHPLNGYDDPRRAVR